MVNVGRVLGGDVKLGEYRTYMHEPANEPVKWETGFHVVTKDSGVNSAEWAEMMFAKIKEKNK